MSSSRQACNTLLHRTSACTSTLHRIRPRPRCLHSTTQIVDGELPPPEAAFSSSTSKAASNDPLSQTASGTQVDRRTGVFSPQYDLRRTPAAPSNPEQRSPLTLTESLRTHLSHLVAQPPFYATIHIHGKPYLVTAGDTIRLPFLMHGVLPGDVLRLDRATTIGSRDFTLKGGASAESITAQVGATDHSTITEPLMGNTERLPSTPHPQSSTSGNGKVTERVKKTPPAYLDDRLFVCRATVMGTESEPMRIKEKTKRRQRHIKRVKSKHKYTILRISEITPKTMDDIEDEMPASR